MTNTVLRNVIAFVGIVFLLLGVLFGTQIITFMFGNLGAASSSSFAQDSETTVLNSSYINQTIFTIPQASNTNFTGGFAVSQAINDTDGEVILAANYTVDSVAGTITNATVVIYQNVSLTYTSESKSEAQITTETANNNSLQSIVTYTAQADTQLNTAAIAITLLILIALFVIFWIAFIKPLMGGSGTAKGGNFAT